MTSFAVFTPDILSREDFTNLDAYSGCVPIASDVDCAGGSGNGPAYLGLSPLIV